MSDMDNEEVASPTYKYQWPLESDEEALSLDEFISKVCTN